MSAAETIQGLGRNAIEVVREAGRMQLFAWRAAWGALVPPWRPGLLVNQVHFLGVRSTLVVLLTAAFTGAVLSLQGFYTLRRFGSEAMLGSAVALSLVRELGPVLTALMFTGRAGSAMTAELGIMRIGEQIDALATMNLEPVKFLVSPRLAATIIALPLLGAMFVVVGIAGAMAVRPTER